LIWQFWEHQQAAVPNELKSSEDVTQTIYEAGYDGASRAHPDKTTPGLMPSKHKKGARGETIRYANSETSLGSILVATTDRGICLVEFAEKEKSADILDAHFPFAELYEAEEDLKEWISEVVAQIDDPHRRQSSDVKIPLDIHGTVFQKKVWEAMTEIPLGETISYTQLAQSLGQPKAVRAVARACASNHLAVLVPCHRVIRRSGDLAGYKWGIERKHWLLRQEVGDQ
jgi:AraC family transcriptional regulator of adaptative response/methylated-DNA-[protein]-cysteine methyltransferase